MTKRIIVLLTFLLLLPALALADCIHHNEDGVPYPLFPQGYIPPHIGVPGYTGDLCCTNCGAIVIRGSEIPALSPENEEEYNWNNKQEQEIKPVNPSSGQEIPSVSNGQSEPSVSSAEQP